MPVMKRLVVGGTTYDTVGEASVTQVVSTGTKIATVSIDGTSTDLYAPSGGSSVEPATAAPIVDGTAAVGTSVKYAREDHVHPTDTSRAASTHDHGSITNAGAITSDTTVASGDKLIIADSSDSSKLKRSGIAFGTSTSTFLRNDGTWQEVGGGGVSMSTATASLATSGWSSNQKTVSVSGVTASNNVIVSPAPASMTAWAAAGVYCSAQGAGTLTFTCSTVPTSALTANVLILS